MPFKDISYLELWPFFCSAERTICAILVEGVKRNYSVKLFEFGPVVQEMSFKRFLIWSSGGPLVQWSGIVYVILKEGIIGNINVILF